MTDKSQTTEPRGCPIPGACSALLEIERLRIALKRIAAVQYGLDMSDPTQDHEAYWNEMATAYRKTASEALKNV